MIRSWFERHRIWLGDPLLTVNTAVSSARVAHFASASAAAVLHRVHYCGHVFEVHICRICMGDRTPIWWLLANIGQPNGCFSSIGGESVSIDVGVWFWVLISIESEFFAVFRLWFVGKNTRFILRLLSFILGSGWSFTISWILFADLIDTFGGIFCMQVANSAFCELFLFYKEQVRITIQLIHTRQLLDHGPILTRSRGG